MIPSEPVSVRRILVITGLRFEADALEHVFSKNGSRECLRSHWQVECAAANASRAGEIAHRAVSADLKPDLVLSFGVAGALVPQLVTGAVIIPGIIVDGRSGARLETHPAISEQLRATLSVNTPGAAGALVSVTKGVGTPSAKRDLGNRCEADAVDMESFAVAEAAAAGHVPFAAIRVVLDGVEQRVPEAVLGATKADGTPDLSKVLRVLIRQPAILPQLIQLGRQTSKAKARLGDLASLLADGF